MNIYEKLCAIQGALKAPKNQRNNFGGYNYRSAEDILEAVKPHLQANRCALTLSDSLEQIGNRYYIKATACLMNTEENEHIIVEAFAREEEDKKGMDGSQITGASSSYARKYALNGLFAIDDTKDSDATNTHGKDAAAPAEPALKKPAKKVEQPAEELYLGIKKSQYLKLVQLQAEGKKTPKGKVPRVAFVEACKPDTEALDKFDDDVFNYDVEHSGK